MPDQGAYFDEEYKLLSYLKEKPYYIAVNGKDDPANIMDKVGEGLCPKLLFAECPTVEDRKYVQQYVEETDGIILSIPEIQSINKRKNIVLATEPMDKIRILTSIFYKDLTRK